MTDPNMTDPSKRTSRPARTWNCPICRRAVARSDPQFPFCSERCRTMDLANWASGTYRVSEPLPDSEEAVPDSDSRESSGDDE